MYLKILDLKTKWEFVLINVHLPPSSREKDRKNEATKLWKDIEDFHIQTPIICVGDFNGILDIPLGWVNFQTAFPSTNTSKSKPKCYDYCVFQNFAPGVGVFSTNRFTRTFGSDHRVVRFGFEYKFRSSM